jgi:hypothetical protein
MHDTIITKIIYIAYSLCIPFGQSRTRARAVLIVSARQVGSLVTRVRRERVQTAAPTYPSSTPVFQSGVVTEACS